MFENFSRLVTKIRRLICREGFASFVRYALITLVLKLTDLVLYPFKRRSVDEPFYGVFDRFVASVNRMAQPAAVLEIGSRNVSGTVRRALFSGHIAYTGFDIHAGENVDVVGDAHSLSAYFPDQQYDAVFSVSVFEHLAMPWKAILEINRILKPGGLLYISTHPVWPPHELPWDFWRFSGESFKVLLNAHSGFEIIECMEGNPARIVSLSRDPATAGVYRSRINQSVAVLAHKCGETDSRLAWDVSTQEMLDSMYPAGTR